MTADDAEFNRRYHSPIFDIGITFGLWLLVATGIYVAKEAERAKLDQLSVIGDTQMAAIDNAEAKTRNKDDGYIFVAAPAASRIAALPIARPIRVHDSARQSRQKKYSADAVPPRNEPFELADAERFDRCTPVCESRDPLIAHAAATQQAYPSPATISSASDAPTNEHVVLHIGREVVERIVDLPRAALDTGGGALESLVQVTQ